MEKRLTWDEFPKFELKNTRKLEDGDIKNQQNRETQEIDSADLFCPHNALILKFHEILNPSDKVKFKWNYLRKVSPNEPNIVILQDIKDLVMYLLISPVSTRFINFFHTRSMDHFLRASILYFQHYMGTWEELVQEREATATKLPNPLTAGNKSKRSEEMTTLRSILARAYVDLIFECQYSAHKVKKHKLSRSIMSRSQTEKDLRLFECLIRMSHRIVWIALGRKYHDLIEAELNRLFRTKFYSKTKEKRMISTNVVLMTVEELQILHGPKQFAKKKLQTKSPLLHQLLHMNCDFRILCLDIAHMFSQDPRVMFLQNALFAKEEKLEELGIKIGILGQDRSNFNLMLMPLQTDKQPATECVTMPPFGFDPELIKEFPIKGVKPRLNKHDSVREQSRKKWINKEYERLTARPVGTPSTNTALE